MRAWGQSASGFIRRLQNPCWTELRGPSVTKSESLFERYCETNRIPCRRIAESTVRTPDYAIQLRKVEVVCEVKQLDIGNREKQALTQAFETGSAAAYVVQNRLRSKLKGVSGQLKRASSRGTPTLVVVYDNTPFRGELDHEDVVEALYGRVSHPVTTSEDGEPDLGAPFLGGNRGLTPTQNTAVSAVAVLDERDGTYWLRVYHNLHAAVQLDPELLEGVAVEQRVLPGDTHIEV